MKIGRITNSGVELIDMEDGREVGGVRTESQLYEEGWKKACLSDRPSDDAVENWQEYATCIVQEWMMPEPIEELSTNL